MSKTILLGNHYQSDAYRILASVTPADFNLCQLAKTTPEEYQKSIAEADYLIASGRLKIDANLLACADHLKMIARTGVGLDAIDLPLLKEKNIPLYVCPGINSTSVAEHTLLLMLSCLRRLTEVCANTKSGIWKKQEIGIRTHELAGKTVCLVGMGRIGKKVSQLLSAFDAHVIPCDADEFQNLHGLFSRADIISLHCPYTDKTQNLLNESAFSAMKEGAVVINTARGGLIDEEALLVALENGQVSAAGLDVYAVEPPIVNSRLLVHPRVVATSHIGGITHESFLRMMKMAIENIVLYDSGDKKKIEAYRYDLH